MGPFLSRKREVCGMSDFDARGFGRPILGESNVFLICSVASLEIGLGIHAVRVALLRL